LEITSPGTLCEGFACTSPWAQFIHWSLTEEYIALDNHAETWK
jgi:hypothetical protein